MNLVLPIPDDLVEQLGGAGSIEREALESVAIAAYRDGRLTTAELQRLLGFPIRYTLDGFLKERGIFEEFTMEDLEREQRDLDRLGF